VEIRAVELDFLNVGFNVLKNYIQSSTGTQISLFKSTGNNTISIHLCTVDRYTYTLAGSGVVRIDPLHFLAGCHTRRLN